MDLPPAPEAALHDTLNAIALPQDLHTPVRAGLDAALSALAAETDLSAQGQARAQAHIADNLCRLGEIFRTRTANPEIADVPVIRPVFILGLPRCGTSLLHAMIGADSAVRTPLSWEVASPSPPPQAATFATDPRAAAFDAYVDAAFQGEWADVRKAHPIGARIPQECGMILETAFQSINFSMLYRVPPYYRWYLGANSTAAYRIHKMWLQHLAWRNPRARWVLKVQEHAYHLPELLNVYPDAQFVQPHRDPVTVMASICRLIEVIRGIAFPHQNRAALGEELLHLWRDGQTRLMATRNARPDLPFLDLRYTDIARAPIDAVRDVYAFAEIDFTGGAQANIATWLAENPADKHGRHAYTLADYGLTAQRVRDIYADYIATYADYIA